MGDALERLLDALADPAAPTTVHEREEARRVHVLDSLAGVPHVRGSICDLGSGAGLPGLVLAASLPESPVTLVESARRKAEWIEAAAARMGLANARVLWARAEEVGERFDSVTARALAALPVLCEYAAPLLADGGRAVFWKGAVDDAEAAAGRAAAAQLGLSEPEVVRVTPYPESRNRTLWIFTRVGPLPAGFPRRAGMATKRPLGSERRAAVGFPVAVAAPWQVPGPPSAA